MKKKLLGSLVLVSIPFAIFADTLELKNGTLLNGSYMGGTANAIRFESTAGLQVIARAEVLALTFTSPVPAPAAAVAPVAPVVAAPSGGPVTVPSGTKLSVKMDEMISSADAAGRKFSAKLVTDLIVDDEIAAKAGTTVYGEAVEVKQAGRLAGKSKLVVSLTGIDFAGKLVEIETTDYAEAGKNSLKKTARNVALGGIIGGATADDGAKAGAAIGLGASVLRRGDSVTIPAGAIIEFLVTKPFEAPGVGK